MDRAKVEKIVPGTLKEQSSDETLEVLSMDSNVRLDGPVQEVGFDVPRARYIQYLPTPGYLSRTRKPTVLITYRYCRPASPPMAASGQGVRL